MLKAVLAALGLPENATEEQATNAISGLKTDLVTATNRAASPSLEKFVPRADFDQALAKATNAEQQLATIRQEKLDADIETAINAALATGKITPATVDYHKAQCAQQGGLDRFAAYCTAAPAIGEPSALTGKKPEGQAKAMNASEKEICEKLGLSEDEYLKAAI